MSDGRGLVDLDGQAEVYVADVLRSLSERHCGERNHFIRLGAPLARGFRFGFAAGVEDAASDSMGRNIGNTAQAYGVYAARSYAAGSDAFIDPSTLHDVAKLLEGSYLAGFSLGLCVPEH
jgi:hypothetical protein